MSSISSNKEAPSEPLPGTHSPSTGDEGELEKSNGAGEPPKDDEPEALTKAEVFLLVVSICVSGRNAPLL
jgi:hypothetical protein